MVSAAGRSSRDTSRSVSFTSRWSQSASERGTGQLARLASDGRIRGPAPATTPDFRRSATPAATHVPTGPVPSHTAAYCSQPIPLPAKAVRNRRSTRLASPCTFALAPASASCNVDKTSGHGDATSPTKPTSPEAPLKSRGGPPNPSACRSESARAASSRASVLAPSSSALGSAA